MPVVEVERNGGRPVSEVGWPFELPVELDEFSALILADVVVLLFILFERVKHRLCFFPNNVLVPGCGFNQFGAIDQLAQSVELRTLI